VAVVVAVALAAPLAAVTVTVPDPVGAVVDGRTVTVAVLPALTLVGLKLTLTPDGAVAERLIKLVNPLLAPTAIVYVAAWPRKVLTEVALGVTVTVGATSVTDVVAVAVATPLVPFTVTVPVPAEAVAAPATMTVAVPPGFTLAGLKATVTPEGVVAERVIELVNPLVAPTATVYVVDWPR
jgi:hypothetical protein